MSAGLERFDPGMGPSERLLAALAFIQGHGPLEKILLVYDTRARTLCAAVRYENDVPVALLRCLDRLVGAPDYVQEDRGMPLLGVVRASRILSGGYYFDGLSLERDPAAWRTARPRPA